MPSERSHPTAPLQVGDTGRTMSSAFAELAELEYRLGDWPAAHASALESLRASQTAGLDQEAMASLVRLACIEAGLGRAQDCRSHAAQATDLSRGQGASTAIEAMAGEAVGFLELGLDRVDPAIDRLERVAVLTARDPGAGGSATTWASDLAEAYVRRGDHRSAERALARLTNASSGVTPGTRAFSRDARRRACLRASLHALPRLERTSAAALRVRAHAALLRRAPASRGAPAGGGRPRHRGPRLVHLARGAPLGRARPSAPGRME